MDIEQAFDAVARDLATSAADVERARMFGSEALKTNGRVFAMVVKGSLVVKLPAARVARLLERGTAAPFDPGHGRVMREWVSLRPRSRAVLRSYVEEARAFLSQG